MSYYRILGFDKEPFSTSPDPDFFYLTHEHQTALTRTLVELRLKRGLSVILGDVGMGKTTLSRKLIQCLKERNDFFFHIILDPCFENEYVFLTYLARNLGIELEPIRQTTADGRITTLDLKEALQKFLFQKCIIENKTVVLIVDEAQKLSEASIEMLRVMLNYETNESKLLQLVLLGQLELHAKLVQIPNFCDRISLKFTLNPLDYNETRDMIHFRIRQAGYTSGSPLFLDPAIQLIHKVTRGYPRKITSLCHQTLVRLVMENKWAVDEALVRSLVDEEVQAGWVSPMTLR